MQYLQLVLRLTPLHASVATLPWAVAFAVGSLVTPRLTRRWSPVSILVWGLVLSALSFALLTLVDRRARHRRFRQPGEAPYRSTLADALPASIPPATAAESMATLDGSRCYAARPSAHSARSPTRLRRAAHWASKGTHSARWDRPLVFGEGALAAVRLTSRGPRHPFTTSTTNVGFDAMSGPVTRRSGRQRSMSFGAYPQCCFAVSANAASAAASDSSARRMARFGRTRRRHFEAYLHP